MRFNEAVRMMKANPEYSIDAISTECGFSSHTWIYRIFKQKTGMSPSQWRKQFASI
ncbi:helix-turn-helix domain-containing protein [Bacteroides sp.]|uniref:helix-turn-helix domain-containing protein n=1 Tax=Bacteroides sp. TaxID=29523 RepID=UPI003A0FCDBD